MKGLVFSFTKREHKGFSNHIKVSDLRCILKRYGAKILFVFLLFVGLIFGSIFANDCKQETLNSLDFLFTTNLDARLSQSAVGTFCACFASDFIFLFSVFLFGFAPWGIPAASFAVLVKGFGTGVTAGFLFVTHSLLGVGFYLLVLLPGTFIFCIALISMAKSSFDYSKRMFFTVLGRVYNISNKEISLNYCSRLMSSLIMTFCASVLDTVLWTLFAGAFNF